MKIENDFKGWFAKLAGLAFAGIIGSAAWETVRPYGSALLVALLNIATFGISSYRDVLYKEVAAGYRERFGAEIDLQFITILVGSSFTLIIVNRVFERKLSTRSIGKEVDAMGKQRRFPFAAFMAISVFLTVPIFVGWLKTYYVSETQGALIQAQHVVAPFVSEHDRLVYASRIAQIRTRKDFILIWTELKDLAEKNDAFLPEIIIF